MSGGQGTHSEPRNQQVRQLSRLEGQARVQHIALPHACMVAQSLDGRYSISGFPFLSKSLNAVEAGNP